MTRNRPLWRNPWLWTSLSALVVAGFVGGWLATPWFVERVCRGVLDDVGTTLGVSVDVDSVDVDSLERIVLHGLTVRSDGSDEVPLATFNTVILDIDSISLWDKTARLDRVTLQKPTFHLVKRVDDTTNFAELAAHFRRFLAPSDDSEEGEGQGGRLWRRLQRHVPKVVITGGRVDVVDRSNTRSLIPTLLPAELALTDVTGTIENLSRLADVLDLRGVGTVRIPLFDTSMEVRVEANREKRTFRSKLRLTEPVRHTLAGTPIEMRSVEWENGGDLRVLGLRVGESLRAQEVAITLNTSALDSANPLSAIQRLLLVRPEIRLTAQRLAHFAKTGAKTDEAVAKPAGPWSGTDPRPKLIVKRGEKARSVVTDAYLRVAGVVERVAKRAVKAVDRLAIPDIEIRGGRISGEGDDALMALARLTGEFSASIRRSDPDMVFIEVSVPRIETGGDAGHLTARIQPGTGDVQLDFQAEALDLYPYRSLLPAALTVSADTTLNASDLRLVYSAGARRLEIQGGWQVNPLSLRWPAVAKKPMTGIDIGGDVRAVLDMREASLRLEPSTLRLGDVSMTVGLNADDLAAAPRVTVNVKVPRVKAQRIVDALPTELMPRLEGLQLAGALAWTFTGTLDMRDMRSLAYQSDVTTRSFDVKDLGKYIDLQTVNKPFTHRVQRSDGEMFEFVTGPGSKGWASLSSISPYLQKVLTTTEDGTFWKHDGIAFFALKSSMVNNLERGRYFRGGSTITMQLVKNLLLTQEKTLSRKLQELFLAWEVDRYLTKKRVLELYLNIVEFGPGIYGISRASRYYFGKSSSELDVVECAFLASLLPSPRRYHYQFRRGRVTERWRAGLRRILDIMRKRGKITDAEFEAAAPYSPRFRGSTWVEPAPVSPDPSTGGGSPDSKVDEQDFPIEAPAPQQAQPRPTQEPVTAP